MFMLDKNPEVSSKLKANGVNKIKFYYSDKDPIVGNIFTVCLLLSEGGQILSRGVSICSVMDMHNKQDARDRSFGRAMKALLSKDTTDEINPNRFTITIGDVSLETVLVRKNGVRIPLNYPLLESTKVFTYKSEFNPILTEKEVNKGELEKVLEEINVIKIEKKVEKIRKKKVVPVKLMKLKRRLRL